MLEALLFGVLIGTLSGLTPGIHSNTLAALLLSVSAVLPFDSQELAIVFISSAITHTFLDFLPSSFIGVPDEDMAVAVLPAHEMVLDGRGIEAASISALSSFLAVAASLPAVIFLRYLDYSLIEKIVVPVVLFFSAYMILNERDVFGGSLASWRKRLYALLVFLTSGFIGYTAMLLPVSQKPGATMLLPLLTGLFAVPVLVASISGKDIPEQKLIIKLPETGYVLRGAISGFVVSLFPGISSGVAAAVSSADAKEAEEYVSAVSASNTVNAFLSLAVLVYFGRVRSGAANAIKETGYLPGISEIVLAVLITGVIAVLLTIFFARLFSVIARKQQTVSLLALLFILALSYYMTGAAGLWVLVASSAAGFATQFFGVRRIHCMGSLMVPVVIFRLV